MKIDTLYAWIMIDDDGDEEICTTESWGQTLPMVDWYLTDDMDKQWIDNPKGYKVELRIFTPAKIG